MTSELACPPSRNKPELMFAWCLVCAVFACSFNTGIIGPRKYTLPHFLSFAEQLRAKAKWLNEQRPANDGEEAGASAWTAQRVQLCLYAEAHDGAAATPVNKKTKAASPAAKRKREKTPSTATTPPSAKKKKENKAEEESTEDQDRPLRRSQRKRQSPAS